VTLASDVDVVVEVMGGIEPARTYILQALAAGKDVVTANKDLIALHGRELLGAASQAGRDLLFEASVAGGVPIVASLKQALAGNRISRLVGIVNGTTNYILTAMASGGREYTEALRAAQELGYAEADPSADVEGLDAARKLAILASIAFGSRVTVGDVYVEGITRIARTDLDYARQFNSTIKLLAIAKEDEGRIEARVHPALVPGSHPLSAVSGVFNAIYVVGDAVGETMFYGRGAGSLPTGSSVVADLIQVARNGNAASNGRLNCTCYRELAIKPASEFRCAYYVRLQVRDEVRVLASLAGIFAEAGVSFASIIQKPKPGGEAEIVLVTHPCREGEMRQATDALRNHPKLLAVGNIIRVESPEE
jgi:homoserine dehydrogenase